MSCRELSSKRPLYNWRFESSVAPCSLIMNVHEWFNDTGAVPNINSVNLLNRWRRRLFNTPREDPGNFTVIEYELFSLLIGLKHMNIFLVFIYLVLLDIYKLYQVIPINKKNIFYFIYLTFYFESPLNNLASFCFFSFFFFVPKKNPKKPNKDKDK